MPIAFSTVAAPEWTLNEVARFARSAGADGVDLRWFDGHSPAFACDPGMTDDAKVRSTLADAGVPPICISTSAGFSEAVWPPVIGEAIRDHEAGIRQTRRAIELASAIGAPFVRVFGFEFDRKQNRRAAVARTAQRLALAAAGARNTGVRVLVENAGSFTTAEHLAELIDETNHPLLGAAYNIAAAHADGESPLEGIDTLADRLALLKVKDTRDGRPRPPGEGDVPCEAACRHFAERHPHGWIVFEWDRAWVPGLAEPGPVITEAIARLRSWATPVASTAG